MENLGYQEIKSVDELKNRVKNDLTSPALNEDDTLFYRFLKARDFDVDKSEEMLRKYFVWRKVHQIDNILEAFKPKEVFVKHIEPVLIGFDKNEDIVKYTNLGRINSTELMKCIKLSDFMKHWMWFAEKNASLAKQQAKKTGRMASLCLILDIDGLEFSNATSKLSADLALRFVRILQDNFPERMKSVYVINAPSYYVFIYSIIKAVVSSAVIKKIRVFGYNGWKEKLLESIDANVLPAFLGGERIDFDDDPYSRFSVNSTGKISPYYYLSEEERYFKDMVEISTLLLRPLEKKELIIDVKESGSSIHWKFMVRNKTICFGLSFQESNREKREVIPMHEYDTSDGTEESCYKCISKGKYIIIFDNSYSRFSTKEVQYFISIEKDGKMTGNTGEKTMFKC